MGLHHGMRRAAGIFELDFATPQQNSSTANLTTYTFSSATFVNPHPHRMIVVGLTGSANVARDVNSVTIGGVSATVRQKSGAALWGFSALAWAKVPEGETLDVVITLSGGALDCRMAKYVFNTKSDTDLDAVSKSNNGTNLNLVDVECQDGGVVIGSACSFSTDAITSSWNGTDSLTEYFNTGLQSRRHFSGYVLINENSTVRDMIITSGSSQGQSVAVSFEF